jgi:hypothetical protein
MHDLQGSRGAVAFNTPVNGVRSTGNSYILEGTYNTDRNVFSIAVVPLMETVSKFRIQTSLAASPADHIPNPACRQFGLPFASDQSRKEVHRQVVVPGQFRVG